MRLFGRGGRGVMSRITRRELFGAAARAAAAAMVGGLAGCRRRLPALDTVVIQGAPSPPSLALVRVAEQGVPEGLARAARFQLWSTADEMRARITSGQAHFSGLPINVAATLYNRGLEVQLLSIYIWGILYLVTRDPALASLEDLRGQTVLIPFRGDLPDILTQYLLRHQGLRLAADGDVHPSYLSAAPEAAQLLAAGRATHAVLSEPSATLAILKARENGLSLHRALDYAQLWAAATGGPARLPMAGVVVAPGLARSHPELVAWFQAAHRQAVSWVQAQPEEATRLGAGYIQAIPPAAMLGSMPYIQFAFEEALAAREEIEFFLSEMHSLAPELVGGRLPPEGFYYRG